MDIFEKDKIGCVISGESQPTMQQFKNERIFRLPNGEYKVFEDHIKLPDLRIHFFADNLSKVIYIGYIGKHLPTTKFN